MKLMLRKELKLATSPLAWIFLAFALMTMLPGYPILVGAFFICMGIFQSFQLSRESGDVLYSVLLPVAKTDYVRSKYFAVCMFQMIGFALALILTVFRMIFLSGSAVYVNNAMMNATPAYLAFMLLVFVTFNVFFVGGFFKTAYKIGFPFLWFSIAAFVVITIAETLHHLPGLEFLNSPAAEGIGAQLLMLAAAALAYVFLTIYSCKRSIRRFELIDL